jgi:phage-related protein
VRDWWSGVVSTFVNAQVRLITGVSNWVSGIVNRFIAVRDRALSYVRSLWSVAQGLFNLGLRSVSNAVRSGLGNVLTFFGNLPGQIGRSIGTLGSMLYNSGRDVVQGLIDGIYAMLGRLGSAASSVAQTIRNYLPFSPAKLGPLSGQGSPEHSGEVIAQMIADGLTTNVNLPARAMQRALSPLAPTGAVTQAAGRQGAQAAVPAGVAADGGVSVTQIFTGPTTSGGRLAEINWNVRYATQARRETIEGVAR